MNALNDIVIAPMVRGLFLDAAGGPVQVRLAGNGRSASSAKGLATAKSASTARSMSIALPSSLTKEDGALDEEKTAAELRRRFAQSGSKGADVISVNDLPGFVEVLLGEERLSFEVLHSSTKPRDSLPENSALGRSSVVAGKIALVTGGAQGFGAEIVRGLAASGAFVYIADLNYEGAQRLSAELSESGISDATFATGVNVTEESSVAAMFETVARTTGGLDLIVSNAGVLKAGSVLDQDEKSFRFVTDVNYTGFFFMAKHGGRLLRRQWRTASSWMTDIIQINSKSGLQGSNKNAAYAGSKFGSIGLAQSFALEFIQYNVKVNAICPGNFFDGPLWADPKNGLFVQYLDSGKVPGAKTLADVKAWYEAKVPMGRGAKGTDVMKAIYYLVEQEYETGQALPVTGGQVMLS